MVRRKEVETMKWLYVAFAVVAAGVLVAALWPDSKD
jgi:hypothetical protein